jgi:hypothetical protein
MKKFCPIFASFEIRQKEKRNRARKKYVKDNDDVKPTDSRRAKIGQNNKS